MHFLQLFSIFKLIYIFTVKQDGSTEILYEMNYGITDRCLIPDDGSDTVVSTGGYSSNNPATSMVTRYNLQGFIEDLPLLKTYVQEIGCHITFY